MSNELQIAVIALVSGVVGSIITALSNRFSSKQTSATGVVGSLVTRMGDQDAAIGKLQERIENCMDDAVEWQQKWSEERAEKHRIAEEAHAAQLRYTLEIGDLKEAHARELATLTEKVEQQSRQIDELRRHVARLEGHEFTGGD